MFRASHAHLQEDTVVYMQHMIDEHSLHWPQCKATILHFLKIYFATSMNRK